VGELDDGTRVVVVPILTCVVRGIDPVCSQCASDHPNRCERIAFSGPHGHLEPGLQTGFCESTGGGWSTAFVAHPSQLVPVPDSLTDEEAVLIEPAACAVHAARTISASEVAIIGAGTLGLLTVAALRALGQCDSIIVAAKHPVQRDLARTLGATQIVNPGELARAVRARTRSMVIGDQLTSGAPTVIDCVGNDNSIAQALSIVAPGGDVVLLGMPGGHSAIDLTPLWHRETSLRGCYAYTPDDFTDAATLVAEADLGRLLSATYPLARYREAIDHAANAGARGAVKIAFDLRNERGR
jgi:threonine dehydrogenase-like Zn-dependent dehydrogenase